MLLSKKCLKCVDFNKKFIEAKNESIKLRENLKAHKEFIVSLMFNQQKKEEHYNDQITILQKLIGEKESETVQVTTELQEKISELKDSLEEKETYIQTKEQKWSELDSVIVKYARKDPFLQEKLEQIQYICDDPATKRKITTVIGENEQLKHEILELKSRFQQNCAASAYDVAEGYNVDNIFASQKMMPARKGCSSNQLAVHFRNSSANRRNSASTNFCSNAGFLKPPTASKFCPWTGKDLENDGPDSVNVQASQGSRKSEKSQEKQSEEHGHQLKLPQFEEEDSVSIDLDASPKENLGFENEQDIIEKIKLDFGQMKKVISNISLPSKDLCEDTGFDMTDFAEICL